MMLWGGRALGRWLDHEDRVLVTGTIVAVQWLVWHFATPWTAARQASLSFTLSRSLLKLMSIESVMLANHLVLRCPLLFLPD